MSQMGQKAKYSLRAHVFRFAPDCVEKVLFSRDQFSKSRWCGLRFEMWGSASTRANSLTDLARRAERALLAEVGSRFSYAQMLPIPHFRLLQHNPPNSS
jgi:hypothetical protein